MTGANYRSATVRHLFLFLVFLFSIGPMLLLVINTLKPREQFKENPFGLPRTITWDNVQAAWIQGEYAQAFTNSVFVAALSIIGVCLFAGLAGYALGRFDFRGKNAVMAYLLLLMSVPAGLFLVPLFFLWQRMHLMDSLVGLTIIYIALYMPFSVFLFRSFFIGIPKELSESAKVDGCTELSVYGRIFMPLSAPVYLTAGLLIGLWSWNEFFFANAFIQTSELRTVATKYLVFVGRFSSDWSKISAAGLITIVPIVMLYILMQRKFMDGIVEGSIKG